MPSTTTRSKCKPVVVGSGPAGVACAHALVKSGLRPLVIDGGRRLEPALEARIGAFDADELRRSFPVDADTLPLKPVYGSTFPYAPDEVAAVAFEAVPSLAVGGLSTVWGAAILPYGERDHEGWPFRRERLESHYRAVLRFVPLAGEDDALADAYPLYVEPRGLRATPQIASLLSDIRDHVSHLADAGVVAGRSRLAVSLDACDYLGLCLLGCPRRAIWSSAQTLNALVRSGSVEHRSGAVVERVEERPGIARVHLRLGGGSAETLDGDMVFLAAGALATARIVLASLGAHDRETRLLDSGYYTFPALRQPSSPPAIGNTLAQVFLEIDDADTSPRPVHLQVYGFNDLMLAAVAKRAHIGERMAMSLFGPVLRRLLFVQGYLHSDESPAAVVRLGRDGTLHVEGRAGPTEARARAVVAKVRMLRGALRMEPIGPLLRVWPPGKGFHVGGSFPMRERPAQMEADEWGRVSPFDRVHLVDASAFPTLPASTITLAVMANAHRVASETLDL